MEIKIQLKKGMIKGNSVYLQDEDILKIHDFFEQQCMIEYVGENNPGWSDEKNCFCGQIVHMRYATNLQTITMSIMR